MEVKAIAKSVRISPKKAREVAALVNGRQVNDALIILEHTPRRAAGLIAKVINSAKANATNNHNLQEDSLVVTSMQVTEGGAMKRWRAAARGRSLTYKHHFSHLAATISGEVDKKPAKKTTTSSKKTSTSTKAKQEGK